MRKRARIATVLLATIILIGLAIPVHAASKKTVYVCTKMTAKAYDDEIGEFSVTGKFSYNKEGLLKTEKMSMLGGAFTGKTTFTYGKKSRIIKSRLRGSFLGEEIQNETYKYSYNNKGYLTKVTQYSSKGKVKSVKRYTRSAEGYCTKSREYNSKGKIKETVKFTRNSKGEILKTRTYDRSGKLKTTEEYTWSDERAEIKEYNAKGKLTTTTICTYKHGDPIKVTAYDETNGHKKSVYVKFSYKKVRTAKWSVVKRQQKDLAEYM